MSGTNMKRKASKAFAVLLTALMLLSVVAPFVVFADEPEHEHDLECGALTLLTCDHVHDASCYTYTPCKVEALKCDHEDGDGDGASDCGYDAETGDGCAVLAEKAAHTEHDNECGYSETLTCEHGADHDLTKCYTVDETACEHYEAPPSVTTIASFDDVSGEGISFDEEDESFLMGVEMGTSLEDVLAKLPGTVSGTDSDGNPTGAIGVSWEYAGSLFGALAYDANSYDIYNFRAVLPATHAAAEGVELPLVKVTFVSTEPGGGEPYSGDINFATFDGVDMGGANSTSTQTQTVFVGAGKTLVIDAPFDLSATDKEIRIELANGLAIESAPGMKYNTSTNMWEFDGSLLAGGQYDGFFTGATFVPNEVYKPNELLNNYSYRPMAGTLTYKVDANRVNAKIELIIKGDNAFLLSNNTTIANAIVVESKQTGGSRSTPKQAVLEKLVVSSQMTVFITGGNSNQVIEIDNTYTATLNMGWYHNSHANQFLFETWQIKLAVPKQLGVTGVNIDGLTYKESGGMLSRKETSLTDGDFSFSIDDSELGSYDYVTINFKPCNTTMMVFNLIGKVSGSAVAGTTYNVVQSITGSINFNTGDSMTDHRVADIATITAAEATGKLTIKPLANASAMGLNIDETNSPAMMIALGGFNISNQNSVDLTGKRLRIDFSDSNVGVLAVKLMHGVEGATNIKYGTTKDSGPISTSDISGGSHSFSAYYSVFAPALSDGEYITWIEYDMGTIVSGAKGYEYGLSNPNNGGLYYYGKLLNATDHTATVTIFSPDTYTPGSYIEDDNYTQLIPVTNYSKVTTYTPSNIGGANSEVKAGDSTRLSVSVNTAPYRYNAGSQDAYKGIHFYLREPEYLEIDKSSIQVTYDGTVYSVSAGTLIPVETTDNLGNKVYILSLPNVILGEYKSNILARYSPAEVAFDVKASASCPTRTILMRDIIMFAVGEDTNSLIPANTTTETGNGRLDVYEVAGKGSSFAIGTVTSAHSIILKANSSLVITTAADRDDNNWMSYTGAESSIINLIAGENARVQINAKNNSEDVIPGGYYVIVPIPKLGETANSALNQNALQSDDFEWSASISGDITVAINNSSNSGVTYVVKYSESYTMTKDSADWKDFSQVTPSQIRAVMIYTMEELSSTFSDSLNFPLTLPDETTAQTLDGAENIFRAWVYSNVAGNAGYYTSEPMAMRLQTGVITGTVKSVYDPDTAQSSGAGVGGITVVAYKADDGTTELDRATTNASGEYELTKLSTAVNVVLVFYNGYKPIGTITVTDLKFASDASLIIEGDHSEAKTSSIKPGGLTSSQTVVNVKMLTPITVRFDVDDGSPIANQYVFYGEKATNPGNAVKLGHSFNGWYKDSGKTNAWAFATEPVVTHPTTIYAKLTANPITVTYEKNDSSGPAATLTLLPANTDTNYGGKVTAPTPPTRTGYTFKGWFASEAAANDWENNTVFNFNTALTENKTLWAAWRVNEITVTYMNNPPSGTDSAFIPSNDAAKTWVYGAPTVGPINKPKFAGYTFNGWHTTASGQSSGTVFTFGSNSTFTSDQTLYAGWTKNADPTITVDEDVINLNTNKDKTTGVSMPYATFTAFDEGDFLAYIGVTATSADDTDVVTTDFDDVKTTSQDWKPGNPAVSYTVKVTVTDAAGTAFVNVKVNVLDDTKPTVKTTPESLAELWVQQGSNTSVDDVLNKLALVYWDDHADPATWLSVSPQRSLTWGKTWDNAATLGTYKLTITTEDVAGNVSESKVVTVYVYTETITLKNITLYNRDVAAYSLLDAAAKDAKYKELMIVEAYYDIGNGKVDYKHSEITLTGVGGIGGVGGSYPVTGETPRGETSQANVKVIENVWSVTYVFNNGQDNQIVTNVIYGTAIPNPPSASRSGYSLNGWHNDTEGKWFSSGALMPDRSITLSASWTYNGGGGTTDPDPDPTTPVTPVRPVTPTTPDPTDPTEPTPPTRPVTEPTDPEEPEVNTPVIGPDGQVIEPEETPLAAWQQRDVWAIMNLLLSLFALVLIIYETRRVTSKKYNKKGGLKKFLVVFTFLVGILVPILFIILSNFKGDITIVDWLTIPLAIMVVCQLVTAIFSAKKIRDEEDDEEDDQEFNTPAAST